MVTILQRENTSDITESTYFGILAVLIGSHLTLRRTCGMPIADCTIATPSSVGIFCQFFLKMLSKPCEIMADLTLGLNHLSTNATSSEMISRLRISPRSRFHMTTAAATKRTPMRDKNIQTINIFILVKSIFVKKGTTTSGTLRNVERTMIGLVPPLHVGETVGGAQRQLPMQR